LDLAPRAEQHNAMRQMMRSRGSVNCCALRKHRLDVHVPDGPGQTSNYQMTRQPSTLLALLQRAHLLLAALMACHQASGSSQPLLARALTKSASSEADMMEAAAAMRASCAGPGGAGSAPAAACCSSRCCGCGCWAPAVGSAGGAAALAALLLAAGVVAQAGVAAGLLMLAASASAICSGVRLCCQATSLQGCRGQG
jgi:hypothetical protein